MIDHRPCFTMDSKIRRGMLERSLISNLQIAGGHKIKESVTIHEADTGEYHVMPIFENDSLEDICNRYSDYFPQALKLSIEEIEQQNQLLFSGSGMSKNKTMMSKGLIPAGLKVMLDTWCGGEFLAKDNWRVRKQFWSYMPKLKTGNSFGKTHFGYEKPKG